MREIMHFNSVEERLSYINGHFEEIIPSEVKETPNTAISDAKEKPKKNKKAKKNDEVQA